MNATRHVVVDTELGETTFVAKGDNLVGCYFSGHWYRPDESAFGHHVGADADGVLGPAVHQFGQYLAGQRTTLDVPLETHGDPFQERVWVLLGEIPFGETTTYGSLAQRLGDRTLAQAMGGAVGRNLCFPRFLGDFRTRFDLESLEEGSVQWQRTGSIRPSCVNARYGCIGGLIPSR